MDRHSRLPLLADHRLRIFGLLTLLVALIASFFGPAPAAHAASLTVTNTNDSGPGSLRQAILDSNASPGADTISFNIPGPPPHSIAVASILPDVLGTTTIDATTQPGYAGAPVVELNGGGAVAIGLYLNGAGATLRGLAMNRFTSTYLSVSGNNVRIAGNYIGTDLSGNGSAAIGSDAIEVSYGSGTIVGGPTPADRNVIASAYDGVHIVGPAYNVTVQGNYIGTNAAGTVALGMEIFGVDIDANDNIVRGNLVSGNGGGIGISGDNNLVAGNLIGTDATGTQELGNNGFGVGIRITGQNNTVGGASPADRNVISGNSDYGLDIDQPANGTKLWGNYIGTDISGARPLPNGVGIALLGTGSNQIGGSAPGQGNVISGNRQLGILMAPGTFNPTTQNNVLGNIIGSDATGTQPLGNGDTGIQAAGSDSRIGGTGASEANIIANNGGAGVLVIPENNLDPAAVRITIRGNSIYNNGAAGIDLSGIGNNDVGDADAGPNNAQNFPFVGRAIPAGASTRFEGLFYGAPNASFTLDLYASPACGATGFGQGQRYLGAVPFTTDADGNYSFDTTLNVNVPTLQFVSATVTDAGGNTSEFSQCISAGPGNDSWPRALDLTSGQNYNQYVDLPDQSRWFKLRVQPDSRALVSLIGPGGAPLPANYDLSVYKDISQAYTTLTSPQDLVRLSAEFAGGDFNTLAPGALDPHTLAPGAFDVADFDPANFDRAIIAPSVHSPSVHSPSVHSPDAFSPSVHSPDEYAPSVHSPSVHSPEQEAYANAQSRSAVAVSALDGAAPESVNVGTWNNTGDFYVRVRGRNGAYNTNGQFNIRVTLLTGECRNLQAPSGIYAGVSGSHRTVILTDLARMQGDADRAALGQRLGALAAATDGVVIDVAGYARVQSARAQLQANPRCPYAANQLANEIKALYANVTGLESVTIIGNDDVIPFFRSPDNAPLGPESDYVPPVSDDTPSQASLRSNYVLGQDAYGATASLSLGNDSFPLPGAAVGRLVETTSDALKLVNAYLALPGGTLPTPSSALVMGYDFLEDAANATRDELAAGLRTAQQPSPLVDTLISPSTRSFRAPDAWTANDLRARLQARRHDLIYLAGHFSANSALASDYQTSFGADELASLNIDLQNALVWSAGCHSGYNIVNGAGLPDITREPDWPQAFAARGATLIAGTGYQYGDTEFLAYSEQIYREFARQLRVGNPGEAISIGKALVESKRAYLAATPKMEGIDDKALREATLFGLPMLQIVMPGERIPRPQAGLDAVSPTATSRVPGSAFGLRTADLPVDTGGLVQKSVDLKNVDGGGTLAATYLAAPGDGVLVRPGEPVLPLVTQNVSASGTVLRGVGFRGGSYTNTPNVRPLVSAATYDLRAAHISFAPEVFWPMQPWNVNYFGALANPPGETRLLLTPAQFIGNGPLAELGTRRQYANMNFRLYYSNNFTTYPSGSAPVLSNGPTLGRITATVDDAGIHFSVIATGDPAAGIHDVWVTYTTAGGASGAWTSLDLTQDAQDSTLWKGDLAGLNAADVRYIVQAANGLGVVTLNDNIGAYYTPGADPAAPPSASQQPTTLTIASTPSSGAFGTQLSVAATLADGAGPLANQPVTFNLGGQSYTALTNASGQASASLGLTAAPGAYQLTATYGGTPDLAGATASRSFSISKQNTNTTLTPTAASVQPGASSGIVATLRDAAGAPLALKSVFFSVGALRIPATTDALGQASLGVVNLPAGTYNVTASFGGSPAPGINLDDPRYNASSATASLTIQSAADTTPPVTTASVAGTLARSPDIYRPGATLTLSANEAGSTSYRVRPFGGSFGAWQPYTAPVAIGGEGENTVEFRSTDAAGNVEIVKTIAVKVSSLPTDVLDAFNRGNGALGSPWVGLASTAFYRIAGQRVDVVNGGPIVWFRGTMPGASQGAFVTLSTADPRGPAQGLLLKVQDRTSPDRAKGAIGVRYDAARGVVLVETLRINPSAFTSYAPLAVSFGSGDQLGAWANASGEVWIYKNGQAVGKVTLSAADGAFFNGKGGWPGLLYLGAGNAFFDDFGGGNAAR